MPVIPVRGTNWALLFPCPFQFHLKITEESTEQNSFFFCLSILASTKGKKITHIWEIEVFSADEMHIGYTSISPKKQIITPSLAWHIKVWLQSSATEINQPEGMLIQTRFYRINTPQSWVWPNHRTVRHHFVREIFAFEKWWNLDSTADVFAKLMNIICNWEQQPNGINME